MCSWMGQMWTVSQFFFPLCANHPKIFLFSKNLNASLFFIRIVWESLKSSTSLSLWQSFNTPDWSVTSRWVNMKLQSQVFLHALCCWMSNTAGWREGTIIYIIYIYYYILDSFSYTKMLARHFTGCFPPPVLVQASTLPVVVVSSTNQVVGAWASVMWSNMLSAGDPRVKISLATW